MENDVKKTEEIVETKKESKMFSFILRHKFAIGLLVVIIILITYHLISIGRLENSYFEKINSMQTEHKLEIDSIQIERLQQITKVFSWAVRSEMNRNNLEEVNNFFLTFVKEKGIKKINLVDPESSIIKLSTDKKIQGEQLIDSQILNISSLTVIEKDNQLLMVTPIMGLDRKIGILIFEIKH